MQRAQAAMLLQDMVTRIEGNRANAAAYVTGECGYHRVCRTRRVRKPLKC